MAGRNEDVQGTTGIAATGGSGTISYERTETEVAPHREGSQELGLLLSLRAWVDWIVVAYELLDEWPQCWYRHTSAINELLALQRWHAAALSEEPAGGQLAQWHDGFARVRERAIRPLLQSCHSTGHVDPSAEQAHRWLELRERMASGAQAYWVARFQATTGAASDEL